MIKVHRLNGSEIVVNAHLVETVESTPDSVILLTTGRQIVVLDSVDDIIEQVVAYRARITSLGRKSTDIEIQKLVELGNDELEFEGQEDTES